MKMKIYSILKIWITKKKCFKPFLNEETDSDCLCIISFFVCFISTAKGNGTGTGKSSLVSVTDFDDDDDDFDIDDLGW